MELNEVIMKKKEYKEWDDGPKWWMFIWPISLFILLILEWIGVIK